MAFKNSLFRLRGKIRHYAWGGYEYIPDLLHLPNPEHRPFAEYWLGAHENAPALLVEEDMPLNKYIGAHPELLGPEVRATFSKLPYLLKVLDVRDMLSIQVHPSKKAAEIEFARENMAGIPLSDPQRNYKDENHKPELMVALSDFWLLHGFKQDEQLLETIEAIPEFAFMLPLFKEGGYASLYPFLMRMEQEEVNSVLQPLLERIIAAYDCDYLSRGTPDFWAARAAYTFNQPGKIDRGIFSIYLLNLVFLRKGEAIFQDAGILHAYLEGQNIEIMANSDNVLRGGLTPKHIDVNELIKHVQFSSVRPAIIAATDKGNGERVFVAPVPDFRLSRFVMGETQHLSVTNTAPTIYLLLEGAVRLEKGDTILELQPGESAISFGEDPMEIVAGAPVVLYTASAGNA